MKKLRKNKTVILRVDGGKKLGFGHLFRSIKISNSLKPYKFKIFIEKDIHGFKFLKKRKLNVEKITKKNEITRIKKVNSDIIILDSIIISKKKIAQFRKVFKKLIIFEDLGRKGDNYANLVFNSIIDGPKNKINIIKNGKKYVGAKYKILNGNIKKRKIRKNNSAVISFGGGDYNNKTITKISRIINVLLDLNIKPIIIYGPGVEKRTITQIKKNVGVIETHNNISEIHSILEKSFLLFCAGGGTIYDGIINKCILFYSPINSHQKKNMQKFQKINCGFLIKSFNHFNLKKDIQKILNNKNLINNQIKNYESIIKRNGIVEIKKILLNFFKKK